MRFLRQRAAPLRFGNAVLNLAGVDYQRAAQPYLVGAEQLVAPGAFNVLLSHNPDVFPVAARQGYQLTIAGHTHGGQVRVEILQRGSESRALLHALRRRTVPARAGFRSSFRAASEPSPCRRDSARRRK